MSTNKPANRNEFTQFCLRQLGSPILQVNVTDDQIQDAVEFSLDYFQDYHFDGTNSVYVKHQITQDTYDSQSIEISPDIIGVSGVFPLDNGLGMGASSDMFSFNYQFALSTIQELSSFSLVPYYVARMEFAQIQELLVGRFPIRFNRRNNILHLDCSKEKLQIGNFIIIEAYQALDPDTDSEVWSDRWLLKYCTALIKKQWGANMYKYDGIQLPGGITMNGQKIYDMADAEVKELEDKMISDFSLPPLDLIM
jgi:hypothetical protein